MLGNLARHPLSFLQPSIVGRMNDFAVYDAERQRRRHYQKVQYCDLSRFPVIVAAGQKLSNFAPTKRRDCHYYREI